MIVPVCKFCGAPESPTCVDLCPTHEQEMDDNIRLRNFGMNIKVELYIHGTRTCADMMCSMPVSDNRAPNWPFNKPCSYHGGVDG